MDRFHDNYYPAEADSWMRCKWQHNATIACQKADTSNSYFYVKETLSTHPDGRQCATVHSTRWSTRSAFSDYNASTRLTPFATDTSTDHTHTRSPLS